MAADGGTPLSLDETAGELSSKTGGARPRPCRSAEDGDHHLADAADRCLDRRRRRIQPQRSGGAVGAGRLDLLTNDLAASLRHAPSECGARQVRSAEWYIEAHAQDAVTISALAKAAGCSSRSLFLAFQRHRGYSPMTFLKQVRLDRARNALLTAGTGETVTQIALDSGFGHLGRFSVDYRQRFGESPSQTLRRRLQARRTPLEPRDHRC